MPQPDDKIAPFVSGVLMGYQVVWVGDEARVKVIEKSRQIGISWAEASDAAITAASAKGKDIWYVGYNKDMAQEFINDCAFWSRVYESAASEAEEFVFDDGSEKGIQSFRIKFASGFRVTALSSRPSNLRGKRGRVIIDEAAFHEDLAGLIKAAMALLMWGGDVRIISSHNGDESEFNDLVKEIRAGKKKGFSLHRVTFDDALTEGLYKKICKKNGKEWSPEGESAWAQSIKDFYSPYEDEELNVIPSQGGGAFFHRSLIEANMSDQYPVLQWVCKKGFELLPDSVREETTQDWLEEHVKPLLEKLPKNLRSYLGEDFARSGDLTVLWPLLENENLKYYVPFAVELSNVPFKQQEQILFYILDKLPRFTGAALDARGNGQYLAEVAMQKYGESRIARVMLTVEWYRENMPKYKQAYQDREITIPRHADITDDHRQVRMKRGVAQLADNSHTKSESGVQRHGDSAIAGVMAWYAKNNLEGGEYEYESVDKREADTRGAY